MLTSDHTFNLVSRGLILPKGWGFPPHQKEQSTNDLAVKARRMLHPFADLDGTAQTVRWHTSLLRSQSITSRFFKDKKIYDPCDSPKEPIEFSESIISGNERDGAASLSRFIPDESFDSLTGTVSAVEKRGRPKIKLALGNKDWDLEFNQEDNLLHVEWPKEVPIQGSIYTENFGTDWEDIILLRPHTFEANKIAEKFLDIVGADTFIQKGLWESWHQSTLPQTKIALCWLLLHSLENAG